MQMDTFVGPLRFILRPWFISAKDVARDSQDNKSQAMTQSRQSGLSTIFQFLFLMHKPQINNKASWDLMSQAVKFAPLVILVTIPPLAYDDNAV